MTTLGVVGCGYWGPNLIRNFLALPDASVKAVCDSSQERLAHLSQAYPGVETGPDYSALLSDDAIDAIAVATPVNSHYQLAKLALEAGKHVFIEKPMARSTEECVELIDLARARNLVLMVGHTFLYTATVRKLKSLIDSGELGEILYISSRRLNLGLFQKDINVTWDLAPHDVSIVLFILGEDPVSVNCQGRAHIMPEIEDVTNMSLSFPNGSFAMIHSSWIDPRKVRETIVVGTEKMVVYDDAEPIEKLKIYDKRVEVPPHYDTFAEFHYSYHYGDMHAPHINHVEPLRTECQHFVDSIHNGTVPLTSGEEGLRVVRILEAAQRSLRKDGASVAIAGGVV